MRKFTEKPCPGCGVVSAIQPGSVCGSCATAIREYPKARVALEVCDKPSLRQFYLGERAGIPSAIYKFKTAPSFAEAMSALLRCVGFATENPDPNPKVSPGANCNTIHYSRFGVSECEYLDINRMDWQIHLPKDVEQHLDALYQAIRDVVGEAEAKGQSKGQSLLFQLNSGALSIDDFNDAATKVRR